MILFYHVHSRQLVSDAGNIPSLRSHGRYNIPSLRNHTPFPQIDIIGAMVIVWRVRGKIIRSVMCNIVRNNCAQCNAHTYEQT